MDAPLSGEKTDSYWVKFFKNAGFSTEVATRHAVIFSNNRIKPDMLPDLDKPSLKEMGITLMGDMIAILRYAKKVVEETTCKKFLVSSEDSPLVAGKVAAKPTIKKVVTKSVVKSPAASKVKAEPPNKIVKTVNSSIVKPALTIKKKAAPMAQLTQTSRLYSDYIDDAPKQKVSPLKRKYSSDEDEEIEEWFQKEAEKRLKKLNSEANKEQSVVMPKAPVIRSQKILKKAVDQKRTVFHRLGDSMVTSTTNTMESSSASFNPTYNIAGTGSTTTFKRNSSVFNRLGNKDSDNEVTSVFTKQTRNGNAKTATQGILKTRISVGPKGIITKPAIRRPAGTMRADEEASKKAVSDSVRQLVRSTKNIKFTDNSSKLVVRNTPNYIRKFPVTGKLASEKEISLSAKSRLGASKQVTFNRITTVNHIKKQGVFSRLGV